VSEDRIPPPGQEETFFRAGAPPGTPLPPEPPPRRAWASLLARSPAFAVITLVLCGWLLWDTAPGVAYDFSSLAPVDLGAPGAYRLDRARENRLAQVRGELAAAIPVTESRTGEVRTVGLLAGTNVVVDRPGRTGPPVFEGRLLPGRIARERYGEVVGELRRRGAAIGDRWLVLRDGERPRRRARNVLLPLALLVLAAVNVRALAKTLLSS
jgi:hypothetical protein